MKIVLASSSSGRKKLLEKLGLKFIICPANINEEEIIKKNLYLNPLSLVKKVAKEKAFAVNQKLSDKSKNYLIIAADSMVYFKGKFFGKPKTKKEAKKILLLFSGQTHEFLTGICLINTKNNKIYQRSCKSIVYFKKLSSQEITDYIKKTKTTSLAGGYSIEDNFIKINCHIRGSKTNVIGLPLEKIIPLLKKQGIKIKEYLPEKF